MPLRLRGGFATECHAFSYFTSSSALKFSPPCGSCSVFEVAHTVYKNALNECSFGCGCPTRNCNGVAISLAQSANITAATLQYHARLRAYHLHCRCGSHPEYAHSVYKNALNECSFIRLRAKHAKQQADNLAELRREFLSVYELIAQILCAVGM